MNELYYCTETNEVFTLESLRSDFELFKKQDPGCYDEEMNFQQFLDMESDMGGSIRRIDPDTMIYIPETNEVCFVDELRWEYDDEVEEGNEDRSFDDFLRDHMNQGDYKQFADVEWPEYTITFRVYGMDGHRQRASFGESEFWDFSNDTDGIRKIDILREDETRTNDYVYVRITRKTEDLVNKELQGQLSDGIFENCRYGKIEIL